MARAQAHNMDQTDSSGMAKVRLPPQGDEQFIRAAEYVLVGPFTYRVKGTTLMAQLTTPCRQ